MIQKVESYQAQCDICGAKSELYEYVGRLAVDLKERGWIIKVLGETSCLCPNCAKIMNTNK